MDALALLKYRLTRLYSLIQKTKNERRRKRLKQFYEHYYETYRKQKVINEEIDQFRLAMQFLQGGRNGKNNIK